MEIQHCHLFFLFNHPYQPLILLSSCRQILLQFKHKLASSPHSFQVLQLPQIKQFFTMPLKKSVAAGSSKYPPAAVPSKSSHQRMLTNKQRQLHKISSDDLALPTIFSIVAQRNEKEEAVKQQALTEAIWSEQCMEEINGFHKRKLPC